MKAHRGYVLTNTDPETLALLPTPLAEHRVYLGIPNRDSLVLVVRRLFPISDDRFTNTLLRFVGEPCAFTPFQDCRSTEFRSALDEVALTLFDGGWQGEIYDREFVVATQRKKKGC